MSPFNLPVGPAARMAPPSNACPRTWCRALWGPLSMSGHSSVEGPRPCVCAYVAACHGTTRPRRPSPPPFRNEGGVLACYLLLQAAGCSP